MNILKHKSWHLYNYDNIERVRRDEENARKEEEARQQRANIAEQEARTNLLRAKARERTGETPAFESARPPPPAAGHINFFYDEERALLNAEKEENEKRSKEEQAEWEKKAGILVGLGQSAAEATGVQPFYARPRTNIDALEISEKAKRRKDALDPLHGVSRYLGEKERLTAAAQAPVGPPLAIAAYSGDGHGRDPGTRGARERRHKDGKKESKRHKKEKRHKKDKLKDKEKPSKEATLSRLREERLARERAERARAEKLLKPHSDHQTDTGPKYSSQFNPHIARQNRPRPY